MRYYRLSLLLLFISMILISSSNFSSLADNRQSKSKKPASFIPLDIPEIDNFTVYDNGGETVCRPANLDEATVMKMRDRQQRLHIISPLRPNQQAGMRIILRGTKQLED